MKCIYCGYEAEENFAFCPQCSAQMPIQEAALTNPAENVILAALKDKMFLAVSILVSVATALSFVGGEFSVLNILFTIFLWLTYSQATKNIADPKHIRCLSGTVYASYVITYVLCGIVFVCGALVALVFGVLAGNAEVYGALMNELGSLDEVTQNIVGMILSMSGWVITLICAIACAIVVLFNIIATRKIHRFTKSVYTSLEQCTLNIEKAAAAKNWLLVFGIFGAISALSSISSGQIVAGASAGCLAAAEIICYVLIGKYLTTEK